MVDMNELEGLLQGLMAEHDSLVQQREIVRQQEEASRNQGAELDRKINGLKQSLQGLSLYKTAKNEPTKLTKTVPGISVALESIASSIGKDFGSPTVTPKTLTECCRDILQRSGEWMSALQVRQSLHAAGFDFSEYKSNPLSSIHITLKRLVEGEQAWSNSDSTKNETLYKWRLKGEMVPPPIIPAALPSPFARLESPLPGGLRETARNLGKSKK